MHDLFLLSIAKSRDEVRAVACVTSSCFPSDYGVRDRRGTAFCGSRGISCAETLSAIAWSAAHHGRCTHQRPTLAGSPSSLPGSLPEFGNPSATKIDKSAKALKLSGASVE
jgi:hypothetical protein